MCAEPQKRNLRTWLFNPAAYIAGGEALAVGLVVIVLTGWVGAQSNTHFDGVLDTHTGAEAPFWCFMAEGLLNWLSAVIVLLVMGKLVSRTSFRFVDLAGTQALARWPMLLTAFAALSPAYRSFLQQLVRQLDKLPDGLSFDPVDLAGFVAVVVVMILVLCWVVALMYRSYALVCNIRGGRAGGSFVVGLIVAEVLSKIAIIAMLLWVKADDSWRKRKGEVPPPPRAVEIENARHYTFDDEEGIEKINGDRGLTVGVENGEFRIHGRTTDTTWGPDSVRVAVQDEGSAVDVSGRFRIEKRTSSGLVFIEAEAERAGSIILIFEWVPFFERYWIQRRWLKIPSTTVSGRLFLRRRGNEGEAFNTMRIHVRDDHRQVDFFVNDIFMDTVVFEENVGPVLRAKMEFQTPRQGAEYDIRFDDLVIRCDPSPHEAARAEAEKETGGLLLHYTFDTRAEEVEDESGQMCPGMIAGAPRWRDGIVGGALALDGLNDYVTVTTSRRLRDVQSGPYTLAAWFSPLAVPENTAESAAVVMKPGCNVGLSYHQSRRFRFTHFFSCDREAEAKREAPENVDGIVSAEVATKECQPYRWYHVAGVADPQSRTISIYLNGELARTQKWDLDWTPLPNDAPWYVGIARPEGGPPWRAQGIFDDVRIYGRALSAAEIGKLFALGDPRRLDNTEDSVDALIQQLHDETPHARYMATLRLNDLGPAAKKAVPDLTESVRDLGASAGASLALGNIGVANDEIEAALVSALEHDSKWDRAQAAIALARLDMKTAVPALEAAADDPDEGVRQHVREALLRLSAAELPDAVSPLLSNEQLVHKRSSFDQQVLVVDSDVRRGTPVYELTRGHKLLNEHQGEVGVVRVHPFSREKPSVTDFSAVTRQNEGVITFHLRNRDGHDCMAVIKVGGKVVTRALVAGDRWRTVDVPFDHEEVLLEGHAGGPESAWSYESLYFTYQVAIGSDETRERQLDELQQKAEQGNAMAQADLGWKYLNGEGLPLDDEKAVEWLTKAAEQGHAFGQYYLGELYHRGGGVPRDYEKAAAWYRRSAAQGNPHARQSLAELRRKGLVEEER